MIKPWDTLPKSLQTDAVRPYYDALYSKRSQLWLKRAFDVVVAFLMLLVLSPLFLLLAIAIKLDSPGPVFYRQLRVTQYGRQFRIFKFRTMIADADRVGSHVTTQNDPRITRVGALIRKCRLDEIAQLLNVIDGSMTFVGTRPEALKYVNSYTDEMMATLLLPAGITSETSIYFKDEDQLLADAEDIDLAYVKKVLPIKMRYNLSALNNFGFLRDIRIMFMTVAAVLGKKYDPPQTVDEQATVSNKP